MIISNLILVVTLTVGIIRSYLSRFRPREGQDQEDLTHHRIFTAFALFALVLASPAKATLISYNIDFFQDEPLTVPQETWSGMFSAEEYGGPVLFTDFMADIGVCGLPGSVLCLYDLPSSLF